jgi:16S rRNA processing protein RimM
MDYCLIGTITKAHGVAGGVAVLSHSDVPGRFTRLQTVHVGETPERATAMTVTRTQESSGRILLHFAEVPDRNGAEALVGRNIYIPSDEMMPPPEGTHFIHDLIGCTVTSADGAHTGTLVDVMRLPAHDAYVVRMRDREIMIPAVEAFVMSVDLERGQIVINAIPGLFDDAD